MNFIKVTKKYFRSFDSIINTKNIKNVFALPNNFKESNSIEKLCDRYVIVTKDDNHDIYITLDTTTKYLAQNKIYIKAVYGAIWTEFGLKYIAKMNDKGKLELL